MLKANSVIVAFDSGKNRWEVHIEIGAEVIKRPVSEDSIQEGDDAIRREAVVIAGDEGYAIDPSEVKIVRPQ